MDVIIDALIDSLKDTLELVPFLFLTYLAMEALEHGMAGRTEDIIRRADKSGPIVGALLGALPQCGFSAMAGTLYAGGVVTVGTLVAVGRGQKDPDWVAQVLAARDRQAAGENAPAQGLVFWQVNY